MTDEREKTKGELTKTREQLSSLSKEKKRMEKVCIINNLKWNIINF